jgi:hypothetical protein
VSGGIKTGSVTVGRSTHHPVGSIRFSFYCRASVIIGLLPILLGAIVGYIAAIPFGLVN